jgi:flagellar capping protein FliD
MSNTVGQLDSTFTNMIADTMAIERQPLTRLTTQQDTLTTQKSIYTDFKAKLDTLLASVRTLKSSDAFFSFAPGRKVSTSPSTTGLTIASAAASSTAVPGNYVISDVVLAKGHSVMSNRQTYSDQGLGMTGTILMGGNTSSSITATTGSQVTVDAITTNDTIAAGQQELGNDTYYVETRTSSGVKQFRLVNSDGKAVSIKNGSTSTFTSSWQTLPAAGVYDTGRGLNLNFTGNFESKLKDDSEATSVTYQAKGVELSIAESDSLVEVASKINAANYADGNEVQASIIDNQLILSTKYTGDGRQVIASDKDGAGTVLSQLGILSGGNYLHTLSTSQDASFKVNGMTTISRSQNSSLTDVISGVTLNLASDAEGAGKTANISVTGDITTQKAAIQDFIKNFNAVQSYTKDKTAVTKNTDGTYTRGALAGDSMVLNLRNDITRIFNASYTNTGTLNKLSDIGLTLDDNNQISISDSTKLENALSTNNNSVTSLLDVTMTDVYNRLTRYTGTNGYVDTAITAATRESDSIKDQIKTLNERLTKREAQLTDQYTQSQVTLESLSSQQSTLLAGFNALSKYSS